MIETVVDDSDVTVALTGTYITVIFTDATEGYDGSEDADGYWHDYSVTGLDA